MAELEKMLEGILENPDTVQKLRALVGGKEQSDNFDSAPTLAEGVDPALMQRALRLMSRASDMKSDAGARLLKDLKPYISDARQKRVDEAVQILSLLRVLDIMGDERE